MKQTRPYSKPIVPRVHKPRSRPQLQVPSVSKPRQTKTYAQQLQDLQPPRQQQPSTKGW